MNCPRCNTPLPPEARFCGTCGLAVATEASKAAPANASQADQPDVGDSPVVPLTPPWQVQQPTQPAPLQPQQVSWVPQTRAAPPYQPKAAVSPGTLESTGAKLSSPELPTRRRRRLGRALLILAIVLLVLVAGWFVGLRPYLHGLAQSQIDGVLSNAINQINPVEVAAIPAGPATINVSETIINNIIVLNTAPSDPVQQMHMTITPAELRLDFQAYGFACDLTGLPQVSNGQLVITNVAVEGIIGLIMSPGEVTATLNTYLHKAGVKLHRNVTGVTLKDHEIDIQLS